MLSRCPRGSVLELRGFENDDRANVPLVRHVLFLPRKLTRLIYHVCGIPGPYHEVLDLQSSIHSSVRSVLRDSHEQHMPYPDTPPHIQTPLTPSCCPLRSRITVVEQTYVCLLPSYEKGADVYDLEFPGITRSSFGGDALIHPKAGLSTYQYYRKSVVVVIFLPHVSTTTRIPSIPTTLPYQAHLTYDQAIQTPLDLSFV